MSTALQPLGNRTLEGRGVEAFDDAVADDRHRNRPPAARDELVVRTLVLVHVVGREGNACV